MPRKMARASGATAAAIKTDAATPAPEQNRSLASRLCVEPSPHLLCQITATCEDIGHALRSRSGGLLADLVALVRVLPETVQIELARKKVAEAIGLAEYSGGAIILTASIG